VLGINCERFISLDSLTLSRKKLAGVVVVVVSVRWTHFPHSSAEDAEEKGHVNIIVKFLAEETSRINKELFKVWTSNDISGEEALEVVYAAPRRLFSEISELLRGSVWLRRFGYRDVVVVRIREDYFVAVGDSPHDEDPALHFIYITSNRALTPHQVFKALEVFFEKAAGDYELEGGYAELLIDEQTWTAEKRELSS